MFIVIDSSFHAKFRRKLVANKNIHSHSMTTGRKRIRTRLSQEDEVLISHVTMKVKITRCNEYIEMRSFMRYRAVFVQKKTKTMRGKTVKNFAKRVRRN